MEGDGPAFLPTSLPSPERLHHKVLIKNKKLSDKGVVVCIAPKAVLLQLGALQYTTCSHLAHYTTLHYTTVYALIWHILVYSYFIAYTAV